MLTRKVVNLKQECCCFFVLFFKLLQMLSSCFLINICCCIRTKNTSINRPWRSKLNKQNQVSDSDKTSSFAFYFIMMFNSAFLFTDDNVKRFHVRSGSRTWTYIFIQSHIAKRLLKNYKSLSQNYYILGSEIQNTEKSFLLLQKNDVFTHVWCNQNFT